MITYCSKCDINWAKLWEDTDQAGDEVYEMCPICKSNMDLGPATDIVAHIMCPFTGKITNVETGVLFQRDPQVIEFPKQRELKVWDETYDEFMARFEDAEDKYIAEYILNCKTMSHIDAAKNATREIVERKYHFETI